MTLEQAQNPIISPLVQTEIEALALSEGALTSSDYVYSQIHSQPNLFSNYRAENNVRTLIALFPNVTMTTSDYKVENLRSSIGLEITVIEPRLVRYHDYSHLSNLLTKKEYLKIVLQVQKEMGNLFRAQRHELFFGIHLHASHVVEPKDGPFQNLGPMNIQQVRRYCERNFDNLFELYSGWYDGDNSAPPFQATDFDRMLLESVGVPKEIFRHPYFDAWLDKFDEFYVRTFAVIFWSSLETTSMLSGRWWQQKTKQPRRSQYEQTVGLARMLVEDFSQSLSVVPDPRTLAEAVEMSGTPQLKRIRHIVDEAVSLAGANPLRQKAKIARDIDIASRDLKRLKRYVDWKERPIVFGARMIAGQVPMLSNLLSAAEGLSWLGERWVRKKHCWIAIP